MKRPDWSRRLPVPLTIPGVMTLRTLADVRDLIEKHMPEHFRRKHTWQYVADQLRQAEDGADPADAAIAIDPQPVRTRTHAYY